jgi:hypothetical protein
MIPRDEVTDGLSLLRRSCLRAVHTHGEQPDIWLNAIYISNESKRLVGTVKARRSCLNRKRDVIARMRTGCYCRSAALKKAWYPEVVARTRLRVNSSHCFVGIKTLSGHLWQCQYYCKCCGPHICFISIVFCENLEFRVLTEECNRAFICIMEMWLKTWKMATRHGSSSIPANRSPSRPGGALF